VCSLECACCAEEEETVELGTNNLAWLNQTAIRGKMDAQDMILDDITRKQLIWYGHVERMDPMRLPKIMIHWKLK
jgi:hypothetical protein